MRRSFPVVVFVVQRRKLSGLRRRGMLLTSHHHRHYHRRRLWGRTLLCAVLTAIPCHRPKTRVILVSFVHLASHSRTSLPLLTMSLRHSCLLLLFSSLSPSPSFSSLLSCYLCHPCFTFYPRHLCSPCTPSSYLLTIVTSVGIACDRGHRHAALCHVAQNI